MAGSDSKFVGSIPEIYDRCLVPFIFEPFAADFAKRLDVPGGGSVLELACGTGVLTRAILKSLPRDSRLVATDLNPPMLEHARRRLGADPRLEWQVADAMKLPFPDASFDRIVCQFGVMFFPDKPAALAEARRVLKPGGMLAFNVWDSVERNRYVEVSDAVVGSFFPSNPPPFFQVPFGYHDPAVLRSAMEGARFAKVSVEQVVLEGTSPTALDAARGLVEGCPLIVQIQERGVSDPGPIVTAVAAKLAEEYGDAPLRCKLAAVWISGTRS